MSLTDDLRKDMFTFFKEGNTNASDILKMALASIKNAQIAQESEMTAQDEERILRKEVKKIEDSIAQFTLMERVDLVEKEKSQLEILQRYLPELMSEEDIKTIINNKIKELNISSMSDMGKLMGAVMKETAGKADGNTVKNLVTQILTK
ncbi:MAG TPA: GatB/YqeY domain-containing protein [Candidatus Dojkabacteria bacterium]|nr:GatB/YqeY domain-containing protein [Candidatus Dojkabacteria bacterium]HOR05847.1 GatB/YqeY domain-containing protein [Candidatus Dojkabacteria bacterium]